MNIDELTIGDAKQLAQMFGAQQSDPMLAQNNEVVIAILDRGWVLVGRWHQQGQRCHLTSASVVRRWGTTKGVGELAEHGPRENTKLDRLPYGATFALRGVVAVMSCAQDKWSAHV